MKKALYIQPVVKTQKIETEMVMEGSVPTVHDNRPSSETGHENDNSFTKKAIIWE